jgi:hypothetical protein
MNALRPLRSFETGIIAAVRAALDSCAPGVATVSIASEEHPEARTVTVMPRRSGAAPVWIHIGVDDELTIRIGATSARLWQNRRHPDLSVDVRLILEAVCHARVVEYGLHSTQLEVTTMDGTTLRLGSLFPPFARRFVHRRHFLAYA